MEKQLSEGNKKKKAKNSCFTLEFSLYVRNSCLKDDIADGIVNWIQNCWHFNSTLFFRYIPNISLISRIKKLLKEEEGKNAHTHIYARCDDDSF